MSKPISLLAPAKVNLFLHICGKRSDGLHLLDSLITFAGIYDSITIKPSPELNVSLKGPFSSKKISTKNNLVLKAAKVLGEFSNIEPKIDNQLIPANGVYCVDAIIEDSYYTGMCNIGKRPTFYDNGNEII